MIAAGKFFLNSETTGMTRFISSSAFTGSEPGRADLAAHVENIRAVREKILRLLHGEFDGVPFAMMPSPENESEITFRIPIMYVREPQSNVKLPI